MGVGAQRQGDHPFKENKSGTPSISGPKFNFDVLADHADFDGHGHVLGVERPLGAGLQTIHEETLCRPQSSCLLQEGPLEALYMNHAAWARGLLLLLLITVFVQLL